MILKDYFRTLASIPSVFSAWIPRLVSALAFCPSSSSSYSVTINKLVTNVSDKSQSEELIVDLNETARNLLPTYKYYKYKSILDRYQKIGNITSFFVTTSRGNKLFCLRISPNEKLSDQSDRRYTIVYSHPNGCDLGIIIGFLWRLSKRCECDVVVYDYSGYGMSSGRPSESNIYADIDCVFRTLINKYKIRENMIILYGESIGSAPTIDLASKSEFSPGGVILHAPIMSGIRAYYNYNRPTWSFDPFPNIDKIGLIKAPVIHGMKDSVVSIYHGISLYQRCQYKVSPLWLKDADHGDVRIFKPFFQRISYFLKECYRFQSVDTYS